MRKVPPLHSRLRGKEEESSLGYETEEDNNNIATSGGSEELENMEMKVRKRSNTEVTTMTSRTTKTEMTNGGEYEQERPNNIVTINRDEIIETYDAGLIDDIDNIENDYDFDAFKDMKDLERNKMKGSILNALVTTLPESPSYQAQELERNGLIIPLAILYIVSYFGAILFFAISGAIDESSKRFLSLQGKNDTDTQCWEVPIFILNNYVADKQGNWQSSSEFHANETNYQLSFQGTAITTATYKEIMGKFLRFVQDMGKRASFRDMAWNFIALSVYRVYDADSNMEFSSVTSAEILYDQAVATAAFFTVEKGMCREESKIYGEFVAPFLKIIVPNKMNETDYDGNFFSNETVANFKVTCKDYITKSMIPNFEIQLIRSGNSEIGFDIRTLTASIGINWGSLALESMALAQSTYPGLVKLPKGHFYVDPYYSDVYPFYCVDRETSKTGAGSHLCVLVEGGFNAGQTIFFPWSVSLNYEDYENGSMCSCPDMAQNEACNQMDVIFLLFYDRNANETLASLNTLRFGEVLANIMLNDQDTGDIVISELFYPLARDTAAQFIDPENEARNDKVKASFQKILTTLGLNLPDFGVLVLESTTFSFFNPLNPQSLQVSALSDITFTTVPSIVNGFTESSIQSMCVDYIYLPKALTKMAATYPTSLINDYYECHTEFAYAFKSSLGNAAGSASLFCAIFLPIMTYLIGHIYNACSKKKKLFSITERKKLEEKINVRSKHALNNIIEGLVDEVVVLRHENIDNRRIISQLLTVNADRLIPTDYIDHVESIKKRHIPDAALQHELIAFKRYFVNEKKESILGERSVRATGRAVEHEELEKLNIEKAQILQESLNPTKRLRLKRKKQSDQAISLNTNENSSSTAAASNLNVLNWFTYN